MTLPYIGLYTTTYNVGYIVDKFVRSLYNIFGKNFILVVVDNYSKDNTYTILKEYERLYGNIFVIQKRSTRGVGYNLALKILLDKFEPEFIARTEADIIFIKNIAKKVVKAIIKHYNEGEIWGGGFASYSTYKKIINYKITFPPFNIFEDFIWWEKLIKKNFKFVWPMLVPAAFTPAISNREKRYARGLEYVARKFGFYISSFYYLYYNFINFRTLSFHKVRVKYGRLIFPEEIGLSPEYLAFYAPKRYFPSDLFKNKKNIEYHQLGKYIVVFGKTKNKLIKKLQQNFLQWLQGKR